MTTQTNVHALVVWSKQRLDEMDATLSALEPEVAKLHGEARAKAAAAIEEIRARRDAFVAGTVILREASEEAWITARSGLESDWAAFEAGVRRYFDVVQTQTAPQLAAFRERAEAQRKDWQATIDGLRSAAAGFAADRKADLESSLARMKAEAESARARLDSFGHAGSATWSAMATALDESRAAFDRANHSAYAAFKRATAGIGGTGSH
jgi:hypothetical protein